MSESPAVVCPPDAIRQQAIDAELLAEVRRVIRSAGWSSGMFSAHDAAEAAVLAVPGIRRAIAIAAALDALQIIEGEVCVPEGVGRSVIVYAKTLRDHLRAVE